nr:hypothetical protein [Gracilibacillus alcaliphilus]
MICADLTDDYTDVTGYYSTHFPNPFPPFVREAPAHFYRKGLHYLVTSGTTGYFQNPSEVACSPLYHGPFEILGNPHVDDASNTSFRSQISSIFKHPKKKDLYIALADRWISDESLSLSYEKSAVIFESLFNPDIETKEELRGSEFDVNTSEADYVWLPFRFDGKMAYLDWTNEWKVEDYE